MKRTTIIILFSVLTVVLLTYFFMGAENEPRYSWRENYRTDSDQPFGTMFIQRLLKTYRPGEKFILNDKTPLSKLLEDSTGFPADYVFIGDQLYFSEEDTEALLAFIHSGNDAFVAARYLPMQIIDSIYSQDCDQQIFVKEHSLALVTMNFYHPSIKTRKGYKYVYREAGNRKSYPWMALQPDIFCDSLHSIVALGHLQSDKVNFFKLPFGKGNLYVHTNPIAFTNYYMRLPDKAEYAAKVLSHLSGKTIIWDEFSRSKFSAEENKTNPLAYILQQKSLRYAWWMMLVSAILYTVFTAKRKQRVIPVREEKVNTSLEYVKMISALHFKNGNNQDIALKKMKYFLHFIRAKYGIHGHPFTREHMERLSAKSQVDLKDIAFIFDEHARIESNPYSTTGPHRLLSLYNAIDNFYKHCK